jgi:23S rRNA pseudouridine1911/1915/1917 synthase
MDYRMSAKRNTQPPGIKTYHVQADAATRTLATALRGWLPQSPSWGEVRQLVRTRRVQIDGNLCLDAERRLKLGEVVRILPHSAAPPPREDDVRIRYLDEHLVIVEKPSGMTSVRHAEEQTWPAKRRQIQPTLEDLLPRIIAKKLAGNRRPRPGQQHKTRTPPVRPVHRIDRETSGLMVFARTVPAERDLGQQFRAHTTGRRYLAIVHGNVEARTIESQLVRDRGDGRRGSSREPDVGKRAVTHVRPIEHFEGYTLVECQLETGRTHQIRIHLSEAGHPICGEKVYLPPAQRGAKHADRSGAPRLALHAAELTVRHPTTDEPLHFKMPLPEDLASLVERLRKKSRSD